MEWSIPIQVFDVANVQVGSLLQGSKPLAPIAYKDNEFTFPSLVLLLPLLTVKSYDSTTDAPETETSSAQPLCVGIGATGALVSRTDL
jgi:hypothetical protein